MHVATVVYGSDDLARLRYRTAENELELELIQTQMTQKPMLRAEVGVRVRCANKASAECIMRVKGIGQNSRRNCKKRGICG